MTGKLNVAIAGAGVWARMIAPEVYGALRERANVVAVIDPATSAAAELAAHFNAPIFADLATASESVRLDCVDVRTPHVSHASVAMEAVALGVNVLVEKPIATTVEEAAALVQQARGAGVTLAVAENYMFLPAVTAARRAIEDGDIGAVLAVRACRAFDIATAGNVWVGTGWRLDPHGAGGVLIDQGPHIVNLLTSLCGEVSSVSAMAGPTVTGALDVLVANIRFASGVVGQQLFTWKTEIDPAEPEAVVYGTHGVLEIHVRYRTGDSGGLVMRRGDAQPEQVTEDGDYFASSLATVADWLDACACRREPVMTGERALAELEVIAAIEQSFITGSEVMVG